MRPQPLIFVNDVEASSRWYQRLLGCQSAHGGAEYERLVANGSLVLQLHSFKVDHHHGPIADPLDKPYGNGLLLWFEIDDFAAAVVRAEELKAEIVMARHRNPPRRQRRPEPLGTMVARSWTATSSFWQVQTARRSYNGTAYARFSHEARAAARAI